MHCNLLRHTYVVIFLQLFSFIGSFHLFRLTVFNTADLLVIPLIFQHRNRSSDNTVDLPIIQSIFQHNNEQTDGQGATSIPPFNFIEAGVTVSNFQVDLGKWWLGYFLYICAQIIVTDGLYLLFKINTKAMKYKAILIFISQEDFSQTQNPEWW